MLHPLVAELKTQLLACADSSKAQEQAAYMKNHFVFQGVPKPVRAQALKSLLKKYKLGDEHELRMVIEQLWAEEFRELQYCAIDIADYHKKLFTPELLDFFKELITQKSWWDSVDGIASLVGKLILKYPELIATLDEWIIDDNLWVRRTALIAQRSFKTKTDTARLFAYCKTCMHEKDFFIRKAIGWALREYSKVDPTRVEEFVAAHQNELSALSIREALKHT